MSSVRFLNAGVESEKSRAVDVALCGFVLLLLLSMLVGALHDVSRAWDAGYYHLPFAARIANVVPREVYAFGPSNEARFAGFPLLGELLQGLLWRITGHIQAANLVAFSSVPLLAWFLKKKFGIPAHLSLLGLLAVPLIHTHATSAYVDLPANAATAIVVLLAIRAFATTAKWDPRDFALAYAAAAFAANTKVLVQPVVAVALGALGLRTLLTREKGRGVRLLLLASALPVVFATPLKNVFLHGNPFFPIRTEIFGRILPGTDDPYSSSPLWLEHAPRFFRFACSVLEIGIRPITDSNRWTIDQWMPSTSTGNRLGGFFGANALLQVVLLAARGIREREGPARRALLAFGLFTGIISVLPQSHELRYHMSWMIVLVSINLWLACRTDAPSLPLGPRSMGVVAAICLVFVLGVTRGAYAYPSGTTLAGLLQEKVDERALSTVAPNARICVQRPPWTLLYASTFHPQKRYFVQEAERPSDCGDVPSL